MKKQLLFTFGLAGLLALSASANQEQLARSIQDTIRETTSTAAQLKKTLASLDALAKQTKGDLRPAYDKYCDEVAKTDLAAKMTSTRVMWMNGDGRRYFEAWKESVDTVTNPSLRKKAQKRYESVKAAFDKANAQLQQANLKFKPFLSDLGDIQKTLANDLTAGGVKSVRSVAKSANWNHQFVEQAVNAALKDMDKMQKGLSAEAK